LHAVKLTDLIQSINGWGETTVKAEDLAFDDGGEGQVVKEFSECFPDVSITVLSQALIIETIDLNNLSKLIITSKNNESIKITNLKNNKKNNNLHKIISSINIITHKKIISVGTFTSHLK